MDRCVLRGDILKYFLADIGIRTEAATREDMKTIDCVVGIADRDARTDHADIADVVLRAGMVAACQMDVDWRLDRNPRFAPIRDPGGRALGIGKAEFATGTAGAGNQAGAHLRSLDAEPDSPD